MSSPEAPNPAPRPLARPADEGRLVPVPWLAHAPVTRALIALNVAVFAVQLVITDGQSLVHLPAREALAFGASYPLATVGENRWETLVTACFLHDGLLHLGLNMLVLGYAGPLVERFVGSGRMAPMYLLAGALGNVLTIGSAWLERSALFVEGASGAISGVVAAALVVGWRAEGWRGSLTQAMVRWLAFIVAMGFLSRIRGGDVANAAHLGGALAGGLIACTWRRGYRYSRAATRLILTVCAGVVVACIARVAVRDRSDRFAAMSLRDREDFTNSALANGRCREAHEGQLAVERLRAKMAPVPSLANRVRAICGKWPEP